MELKNTWILRPHQVWLGHINHNEMVLSLLFFFFSETKKYLNYTPLYFYRIFVYFQNKNRKCMENNARKILKTN